MLNQSMASLPSGSARGYGQLGAGQAQAELEHVL
jgi:hypothetical protein